LKILYEVKAVKEVSKQSKEQVRWNQYGQERIKALQETPDRFIIHSFPLHHHEQAYHDIMKSLNSLKGKKLLELGCGRGDLSVFLAKQGAKVTGVDAGENLIVAATLLAEVNQANCEFQVANITDLPFEADTYDMVLGIAILHHLSQSDLNKALQETYKVLTENGVAFFVEPVEDSKVFNFIQNIFPRQKKGSRYHRPSILQRKAWKEYVEKLDDRALTTKELRSAGKQFKTVKKQSYGFLIRLQGLIGKRFGGTLMIVDRILLRIISPLRYLCQTVLVEYRK
jgi:2-polyprenyl-3-methyl-5-hydroxy-6-metoxy-1,4-benzoquinol methylase